MDYKEGASTSHGPELRLQVIASCPRQPACKVPFSLVSLVSLPNPLCMIDWLVAQIAFYTLHTEFHSFFVACLTLTLLLSCVSYEISLLWHVAVLVLWFQ